MAIVHPKAVYRAEYRVEEYDGIFQIQRKEVKIKITRFLFKKNKVTEEIKWKFVDKWGNCLFYSRRALGFNNYECKIEPFKDLKSAFDKIDVMIKGETYHYKNETKQL